MTSRADARLVAALTLGFLAYYVGLSHWAGLLGGIPERLLSSPDARVYAGISGWLFGMDADPSWAPQKPWLYPFMLGIQFVLGPYAVWLLNLVMLLGSATLCALAVRCLAPTGRGPLVAAYAVVAASPSLVFLTYHALADIAALFFLALWLFSYVRAWALDSIPSLAFAAFAAGLLLTLKPIFVVLLVVFLLTAPFVVRIPWKARLGSLSLAIVPAAAQALLMASTSGSFADTTGPGTVKVYYLPRLMAVREDRCLSPSDARRTIEELRERTRDWSQDRVRRYILENVPRAVIVLHDTVVEENMQEGSAQAPRPFFYYVTKAYNVVTFYLHVVFAGIVGRMTLRGAYPIRMRLLAVSLALVLYGYWLETGIAYWQGDRYIAITSPLWFVLYVLALRPCAPAPARA